MSENTTKLPGRIMRNIEEIISVMLFPVILITYHVDNPKNTDQSATKRDTAYSRKIAVNTPDISNMEMFVSRIDDMLAI